MFLFSFSLLLSSKTTSLLLWSPLPPHRKSTPLQILYCKKRLLIFNLFLQCMPPNGKDLNTMSPLESFIILWNSWTKPDPVIRLQSIINQITLTISEWCRGYLRRGLRSQKAAAPASTCSAPDPRSGTAAPSPTHSSSDHVQLLVQDPVLQLIHLHTAVQIMFSSWSRIWYCSSFTYTQQFRSCSAPGPGSGTAAPSPKHSSTDHVQLLVQDPVLQFLHLHKAVQFLFSSWSRILYCSFTVSSVQFLVQDPVLQLFSSQSSTVYTYIALIRKGKEPLVFYIGSMP